MSDLLETLRKQLGGREVSQIAKQVGADEGSTAAALGTVLPTLLGALAKNTAKPEGAAALHNALAKDHDGSVLDNLSGFLSNPSAGAGDDILRHVLGGRRQNVERNLSKASGMPAASVGKLMATLAPVVLAALGRKQRQSNLNAAKLASFLGQERESISKQAPREMGAIGALLDTDGDGDVDLQDIAKKGAGMLGKLLNR